MSKVIIRKQDKKKQVLHRLGSQLDLMIGGKHNGKVMLSATLKDGGIVRSSLTTEEFIPVNR